MAKKFNEMYEEKRKLKKITLKQIGDYINKTPSFINEVVKGRRIFKLSDLYRAVDILKLSDNDKKKLILKYIEEESEDLHKYIKKIAKQK